MSRPRRTEAEIQWRRERIVEASAAVFQRVGIAAATMEEIAREADYSPAALYNYFRSKDDIVIATMEQITARMVQTLEERLPDGLSFEQRLRWRVRRTGETAFAHRPLLIALEGGDGALAVGAHAGRARACMQSTHEPWRTLMAEGQAEGALRTDLAAEHLASALVGMLRGTLAPLMAQREPTPFDDIQTLADRLIDLFLNGARLR